MAKITHLQLPSGNVYELADEYARQLLAAGLHFIICWDGTGTPDVTKIPAGVIVTYQGTDYAGTMAASTAQPMSFYLVKVKNNVYTEYVSIRSGEEGSYTYSWEALGDTSIDLSDLGALAYKDSVTLSKGSGANVLGENATFSVTGGAKTKTHLSATASGAAVSTEKDSFVKSYPGTTSKMVQGTAKCVKTNTSKTIPNVTSVGSASSWAFSMGTGADAETLIISGANGSAPSLGTAIEASLIETEDKSFATGALDANGGGASVMTGLGTATTAQAVTSASVSAQPSVTINSGNSGDVEVMTDMAALGVETNAKDAKKVALYDDLGVSAS